MRVLLMCALCRLRQQFLSVLLGCIGINHLHFFAQQVRSYGDLFREGDTVGVTLDMDAGTLEFFLNGVSLGVAVEVCC